MLMLPVICCCVCEACKRFQAGDPQEVSMLKPNNEILQMLTSIRAIYFVSSMQACACAVNTLIFFGGGCAGVEC